MARPDLTGRTALVTGASSGIGAAMARHLAGWRCDLVLTARRADRLEVLAGELARVHGVRTQVVAADLADSGGPARLHDAVRASGVSIDLLINNAGAGPYRAFAATRWPAQADMIQLNVTSLVELTHRFLPDLVGRPDGAHILNVASVAAFVTLPYFATYGGTKAFVLSFSQALAAELAATGVTVTCLCPGGTLTEFPEVAGQTLGRAARSAMMSAERCAEIGLHGMLRGRRVVVPGATNRMTRAASRLLPQRLMSVVASRILGKPVEPPARLPEGEP